MKKFLTKRELDKRKRMKLCTSKMTNRISRKFIRL